MAVDISPKADGGVLKEIIKEGVGEETPAVGNKVSVHYTGYLLDGTKFDSSRDRAEPFSFELHRSGVIKAWNIGVGTMKKGEIATLTCAPEYAYGKGGFPPSIPPDAYLKFEIEMIDWEGVDLSPNRDGSITKNQILAGKGYARPNNGSLVNIHLTGSYNDNVFEDREVQFTIGEGEEIGIVKGVEKALQSFSKGEKSRLTIKSKYAFGKEGKPEFNIPEDATVEYEVELKTFEKGADLFAMQPSEKIELAKMYKEKGTNYFKSNKYKLAITMYKKMDSPLASESYEGDLEKDANSLMLSSHLNLALCYLKIDQSAEARDQCHAALQLDPDNEKALFRRGQAYLALASPDLALKDFQEVVRIEPKNTAASKQIAVCNNLIKKQIEKDKRLYANMFEKFAQEDRQKEEEKLKHDPDVMRGALGVWGHEERAGGRDPTAFEKENPNILMLNADTTGEFQNM